MDTMFWNARDKLCKQKSTLFPNRHQSLAMFVFFLKTDFWAKKHFSAKRKNGRFPLIPGGTRFPVIAGHFLWPGHRRLYSYLLVGETTR